MTDDTRTPERLERDGWDALVAGGTTAREFYADVLDEHVGMLLPGGLRLADRELTLQTMGDSPWDRYELEDVTVTSLADDVALVTYGAVAHRGDQEYSALMSSVYVRRGDDWRLAFHQQTPR
ncbi:nuclear transport factor 2 family protein [Actinotalea sp. AC32]|nr:nuclear transport factor 2 family protein [Actinotalea sp. AC32]